jgi:hypothetical protein
MGFSLLKNVRLGCTNTIAHFGEGVKCFVLRAALYREVASRDDTASSLLLQANSRFLRQAQDRLFDFASHDTTVRGFAQDDTII